MVVFSRVLHELMGRVAKRLGLLDLVWVLDTVRESYPARRWSEALAAFLHDRGLLGQE